MPARAHKRNRIISQQQQQKYQNRAVSSNSNNMASSSSFSASSAVVTSVGGINGSTAISRIRTPHAHDVLSGRGGGINAHAGNQQFRAWVRARKEDYTLASCKQSKATVAQQVIDIVRGQSPPGRFLQKDSSSFGGSIGGYWIELDADKVMAKTSQALREGAPQIRAAHRQDGGGRVTVSTASRPLAVASSTTTVAAPKKPVVGVSPFSRKRIHPDAASAAASIQQRAVAELRANAEQAASVAQMQVDQLHHLTLPPLGSSSDEEQQSSKKRARIDYNGHEVNNIHPEAPTPPLSATTASMVPVPPLSLNTVQQPTKYRRSHSLALSDVSSLLDHLPQDDFVNPFEQEEAEFFRRQSERRSSSAESVAPAPVPGVYENTTDDDAGVRALMRSTSSSHSSNTSHSSSVRPKKTEMDLADPLYFYLWSTRGRVAAAAQ